MVKFLKFIALKIHTVFFMANRIPNRIVFTVKRSGMPQLIVALHRLLQFIEEPFRRHAVGI